MTTTTKRNYGLDLGSPVYFVVGCLVEGVGPEGADPTLDAMASNYRHLVVADFTRIKPNEGLATNEEATRWLIEEAIRELGKQVEVGDDGVYRLTRPVEEVRWPGQKLLRWQPPVEEPPADLLDGGLTTGVLVNNFGRGGSQDDLSDLLDSMRTYGWIPEFPAIRDERKEILVGHRRLAAAAQLRAEGLDIADHVIDLRLGSDGHGRVRRLALSEGSNRGMKPLTPAHRKEIARAKAEAGWTTREIAKYLGVHPATAARDTEGIVASATKPTKIDRRGRKASPGRPRKAASTQPEVKEAAQAAIAPLPSKSKIGANAPISEPEPEIVANTTKSEPEPEPICTHCCPRHCKG